MQSSEIETLEDWVPVWIHRVLPGVVKETTCVMYQETMERHILPSLGKKCLKELDMKAIGAWLDNLQKMEVPGTMAGRMTEGTVRNTLSVLSGCLRDAQKYGLIEQNPCLQPAWKVKGKNVWEDHSWLDGEQIEKLEPLVMQYRDRDGYPRGIIFQLILYGGLTMSEAVALRWGEVDLEQKVIHIRFFMVVRKGFRGTIDTAGALEEVEGRRKRAVPIPDFLVKRLADIRQKYQVKEEYFVGNPSGEEFVRMDALRTVLFRRSEAAGLGRITPRMLRDTYAIRAVQAGATSDMIAELMGFASPQQVIRRYMPNARLDGHHLVNQMYQKK